MDSLIAYSELLMRGAVVTVALALASLALATFLGALSAAAVIGGGPILRGLSLIYTTFIRGIPDLVMMLLLYFGGQRLLNDIGTRLGWDYVDLSPFLAGMLAIGLIFGAYLSETFRGAYQTVPRGQGEAARALGLRPLPTLWNVTLPQLLRFALPGYANVWQVLVKSTAVVSVIGLNDLVKLAGDAGKTTREPFTFYLFVFVFYLFLTWVSQIIFDRLERKYAKGIVDAH
ncbi:ABC transporter permease [Paracoccaceae bacterium GXU_MW_L88]